MQVQNDALASAPGNTHGGPQSWKAWFAFALREGGEGAGVELWDANENPQKWHLHPYVSV